VGSGLPQTVMLVNLTASAAGVDRIAVNDALEQQRQQVNDAIEAHERISHVVVCAEPWTLDNGLLTHTLKLLRDDVEKKHGAVIERCMAAADGETVIWE